MIIYLLCMKTITVNLTDAANEILMNHKIKLQQNSIKKNISFTDAINDFVESMK